MKSTGALYKLFNASQALRQKNIYINIKKVLCWTNQKASMFSMPRFGGQKMSKISMVGPSWREGWLEDACD